MAGLAQVQLIGNLGRDPETRYTPNGTMNVQFSLAVSKKWTDQGGNPQEKTTWYRVTCWSRLAETMDTLTQRGALIKGKQVFVNGGIESREYVDRDDQTRTSLDVRAETVLLLGARTDGDSSANAPANTAEHGTHPDRSYPQDEEDMNDVPF